MTQKLMDDIFDNLKEILLLKIKYLRIKMNNGEIQIANTTQTINDLMHDINKLAINQKRDILIKFRTNISVAA